MTLKLYCDLLSQPSRALYIFFKTCNIPFAMKRVNLAKMEHLTPEYQQIHPFQKVPAIEHNGFNLIESVAIFRYICREYEVPDHWYPADSKRRAKVDEFLEWQHHNTRAHCALYFRGKFLHPIMTGQQHPPEKLTKLEKNMKETLDILENVWLKNQPYLIGSEITVADILAVCEVEQVPLKISLIYSDRMERNLMHFHCLSPKQRDHAVEILCRKMSVYLERYGQLTAIQMSRCLAFFNNVFPMTPGTRTVQNWNCTTEKSFRLILGLGGYEPRQNRPRLAKWMERIVKETSPYYEEANVFLNKIANRIKEKEQQASML